MSSKFNPKAFLNAQNLPLQELKHPSFCSSNKAAKIETWVSNLHATKITHTSVILYNSIPELNRVKTDYENRLNTLEAVRPTIQHCIEGLTKDFLHQPLNQTEDTQKFAIIAQALQKYMVDGYLLCLRDMCNLARFKPETFNLLAMALHRAISGIGMFFFRSYQLYTTAPSGLWLLLHGLYQSAEYYQLLDKTLTDPVIGNRQASSLRNSWLRIVMLASCKPNQLSKNDVAHTYRSFINWAPLVKINEGTTGDKDNFYIVNISRDEAPCYKSRFAGSEVDRVLELDFKTLLGRLSKQDVSKEDVDIETSSAAVPKDFPDTLLDHLLNTWGNITQRKLGRRDVSLAADIGMGLVDCHYFIAGKRKFEDFISGNSDLGQAGTAFTPRDAIEPHSNSMTAAERPKWPITIQNVSAGGYCIMWKGDMPPKLESGELVCLKEQNRYSWNLGVIRWIKQLKDGAQLGVQLLSNHSSPCGAAQLYDTGGQSDFMRALLLPQHNQNNQPKTLITSRTPFGEMQKARILTTEREVTVRLGKCLFSTGSVKQFAYTEVEGSVKEHTDTHNIDTSRPPAGFDSSWDDI